ncbi:hypothetical protein RHSIM_Rhsim13G0182900 [Rhododendron simsii]|uniref:GDSL esterase/lipase n=1 Tax=Rhododendron simsii TaxID=118357 RepID=A0A834L767_RHOSS|nr:hypothetical protein RHSIM_Rhsim13G0182900 [Rhododendron simsii]
MSTQLEYFKQYKARLASTIGQEGADNLTTNAVFFVNCAVNDFVNTFYGPGHISLRAGTTIGQYEDFVLQLLQEFIQGLVSLGARRIAVSGVPLFGCWPSVITLYSSSITNALITRACNDTLNAVGNDYNMKVQAALRTQQNSSANIGLKLAYFDTYTPMVNIRRNPAAFDPFLFACLFVGIDVTNRGCCGTGLLEGGPLCNSFSALCANRSEYEFFDSVHPTQTTASIIVNANVAAINSITKDLQPSANNIFFAILKTVFLYNPDSYACSDALKYVFWNSIHPSPKTYKLLFVAAKSDIDFIIAD